MAVLVVDEVVVEGFENKMYVGSPQNQLVQEIHAHIKQQFVNFGALQQCVIVISHDSSVFVTIK